MKINIKKKLKSAGSTIKEMGSINKKSLKNEDDEHSKRVPERSEELGGETAKKWLLDKVLVLAIHDWWIG